MQGTTWLVHILPYIDQAPLHDLYDFDLPYTNEVNKQVGNRQVPGYYCPSGPDPLSQRARSGNSSEQTMDGTRNLSTHYYGIMGPNLRIADPQSYTFQGKTYTYRVGTPTGNDAYGCEGLLQQYRDNSGSITTKYYGSFKEILDGASNVLLVGERSMHLPAAQAVDWRSWIRGNNGGSGATKNVAYPINSTFYNGSDNFNDISMGSDHAGGTHFLLGDGSVQFVSENIDFPTYLTLASRASLEPTQVP
jgi:hypothetical protein